ncbi:hypothetical protein OS493_034622 [Desmophyllum pertusum]|uniref:MANSC domain-containing protein n=1 Tax=Desmophyllum pertusum TaxID=174260 RepID=A0A9W9ZIS3_9CNID|nr:hypothetical protein OS493_034622 [Desmophyllum pertusum]
MWLTRRTVTPPRNMYIRVLLLCLCAVCKVKCSSNYLENCKNTKIEENVTLKGGIGAGTFRKLGKVTSMESCIELCCKTSTCDVAFLSASKCYGVECVSDEECEATATDTSDIKVLIAHVRTGHKKDNTSLAFITPNFTSNVKQHPNGFLGPNQAGLSANTPKGLIAQGQKSLDNVNPSMAGKCQPGKVFKEVTLKGGINAGTYKDVGSVKTMEECSSKCCEFAACDLAFMLSSRCYLVGCSEGKDCQIQKAKPSPYHPSVTYIERWNKEGVKHTVFLSDSVETKFTCPAVKPLTKVKTVFSVKCYNKDLCSTIPAQPSIFNPQIAYVWTRNEMKNDSPKNQIIKPHVVCPAGKVLESVTLIGGITSGYFRDHGKVKDMQKCRRICCEMPHCHLAFMLSSNCFSVACKSASACKTQPANPSRYNPKISYVRDYASNDLLGAPKVEEQQTKETIPGLMQTPLTPPSIPGQTPQLPGQTPQIPGLNVLSPEATQMAQFSQTQMPGQQTPPLLGQQQQPTPLVPPPLPPSPFGSIPQMGQKPMMPLPGVPLDNSAGMQFPIPPAVPAEQVSPVTPVTSGGNQPLADQLETKKTEIPTGNKDQSFKSQIKSAAAGQAMTMNIVNGKIKLTPVEGSNSSDDASRSLRNLRKPPRSRKTIRRATRARKNAIKRRYLTMLR